MIKILEYFMPKRWFRKKPLIKFIRFCGKQQLNGKIRVSMEFEIMNNDPLANCITVAKFFHENKVLYSNSSILVGVNNGENAVKKIDLPIPLSAGIPITIVFSCQFRKDSGIRELEYYFEDTWQHRFKGTLLIS
jgi:hypothetical protein